MFDGSNTTEHTEPQVPDKLSSYQERKLAGQCVYEGCPERAADDSVLCRGHQERARARTRTSQAKLRDARRLACKCIDCGKPIKKRAPPHSALHLSRCPTCRKRARVNRALGHVNKPDAISSVAITTDRIETDGYARKRFHGGSKDLRPTGRQSNAQLDAQDIAYAVTALRKSADALAEVESPEIQALPRIQREAAKRAALSQVALAKRHVEEVLERNRYEEDLAQAAKRPRE